MTGKMISLNKGDFYKTHAAYRVVLIYSTCSSNRQYELNVTHPNTPTALPRFKNVIFHTITSCRKTAVVLKLSNVTFAEFFTKTTKN